MKKRSIDVGDTYFLLANYSEHMALSTDQVADQALRDWVATIGQARLDHARNNRKAIHRVQPSSLVDPSLTIRFVTIRHTTYVRMKAYARALGLQVLRVIREALADWLDTIGAARLEIRVSTRREVAGFAVAN